MLPFGHSCKGSTTHCASIFWNHTRKQVKKHYTKNGQTVQIISAKVANPLPVIFTLCPKNWVGTRNDVFFDFSVEINPQLVRIRSIELRSFSESESISSSAC